MKSWLTLFIALLIAGVLAPAAQARPTVYAGTGVQTERGMKPTRWSVRLHFLPNGNAGIRYPSLGCSGVLVRLRQAGGVTEYREHIRIGRRVCVDLGTVKITRHGNRLQWRWSGERTRFRAMRARATLLPLRFRGR